MATAGTWEKRDQYNGICGDARNIKTIPLGGNAHKEFCQDDHKKEVDARISERFGFF
jgi:hypothetical protein